MNFSPGKSLNDSIEQLLIAQGYACKKCSKKLTLDPGDYAIDHVLSAKQAKKLGIDPMDPCNWNLLCHSCNFLKADKDDLELLKFKYVENTKRLSATLKLPNYVFHQPEKNSDKFKVLILSILMIILLITAQSTVSDVRFSDEEKLARETLQNVYDAFHKSSMTHPNGDLNLSTTNDFLERTENLLEGASEAKIIEQIPITTLSFFERFLILVSEPAKLLSKAVDLIQEYLVLFVFVSLPILLLKCLGKLFFAYSQSSAERLNRSALGSNILRFFWSTPLLNNNVGEEN